MSSTSRKIGSVDKFRKPLHLTIDTSFSTTATLPLGGEVDATIDWGDGVIEDVFSSQSLDSFTLYTHDYSDEDVYSVRVWGKAQRFGGDQRYGNNVTGCRSFGNIGLVSLENAFRFFTRLQALPSSLPSTVNNLKQTFFGTSTALGGLSSITRWDVSNVTNMQGLFRDTFFNQDISGWSVSNVTDMSDMFRDNRNFNQDIRGWDVSNVTSMRQMFYYSEQFFSPNFNQDVGAWDVSNVSDFSGMFRGASAFNQDIGGWDVSNAMLMDDMLRGTENFNQNLTQWCVINITSQPSNFATNSALDPSNYPVWGTCP